MLERHRAFAIIRTRDPELAVTCALTLVQAGVRVLEISLTTPDALEVIRTVTHEVGDDGGLGAGTVPDAAALHRAVEAGAAYAVTPALNPAVREAVRVGVPVVAGALTPTEVATAVDLGADAIKIFPASLGGPRYIRALTDPFPEVAFAPVGGVSLDSGRDYLDAGAVAVGLGSPLLADAAQGGDLDALAERAHKVLASVARS
ncbi:MAG: bifunctional 4-hydroxy-2-oxoglutarate aldolase/2-dehydro-3-deoxy-phosphogluconate aldolase [Streptosporangiales bacterium]|nr:bifunctional 4-hydroxy-2-oxoglutarate aldolase/2-dehydro-3-deoxy-phosphogluconate aldolase [Streptosporangiales bacterium]